MRVDVAIPDVLFHAAEETAARLGLSRGELYARAVARELARLEEESLTAEVESLHGDAGAAFDPLLAYVQRQAVSVQTSAGLRTVLHL